MRENPNPDWLTDPAVAENPDSRNGRRILSALRRIIRAVDLYSRRLAAEHQITGPQLVCLNTIVEQGPITATDLAGQVQLSPSTVVRILDRLEAKGFVRRERLAADRRRIHVTATPAGHELSARAPYSQRHPLRQALRELPVADQETVIHLLERLVGLLDAASRSASPVLQVGDHRQTDRADGRLTTSPRDNEAEDDLSPN